MNTRKMLELIGNMPLAKFDPYKFAVEIAAAQKEEAAQALDDAGWVEQANVVRALE